MIPWSHLKNNTETLTISLINKYYERLEDKEMSSTSNKFGATGNQTHVYELITNSLNNQKRITKLQIEMKVKTWDNCII